MAILLDQEISYSYHIKVDQKSLYEIPYYTKSFTATRHYNLCTINYNIPFTSNDTSNMRSKIVLYLDGYPIYDAQIVVSTTWNAQPLTMIGHKANLNAGTHYIRVYACVEDGILYIPYFDPSKMENTMSPKMFGSVLVTAFN